MKIKYQMQASAPREHSTYKQEQEGVVKFNDDLLARFGTTLSRLHMPVGCMGCSFIGVFPLAGVLNSSHVRESCRM